MNQPVKILIVDDNRDLLDTIQEILMENAYTVSTAQDGASAIERCREETYDLAILDYKLPDMDGLELQERLAQVSDADFIMITAHASIESAAEAVRRKQVVGYETKPLDLNRLLAFVKQVVDRRRAQRQLENANALLTAVFQAIPAHINVTDLDYNILEANVSDDMLNELGFDDKSAIMGRKCHEVFKQRASPCPECTVAACLKSGKLETRLSTEHEDELLGYATKLFAMPVKDKRENLIGAVECAMDVTDLRNMQTELRRARDEAEHANRAKSSFLANMSHEIRTPVNAIVGFAHILKDTPLTDEQKKHIRIILASSELLLALIDDILDFSKIEADMIELEEVDFNLFKVIGDLIDVISVKVKDKEITMCYDVNVGPNMNFRGDLGRLQQVLLNLAGNAAKFTERGEIRIAVACQDETDTHATLRFAVHDTGIGISDEEAPLLFETFFQADASISRKYGGAGLGLAICKKIVELMGGQIGVRSEPGKGSEFWFTATLQKATAGDAASRRERAAPEISCKEIDAGWRILVAEDNYFNQEVIQAILLGLGLSSEIAKNGREALDMLAKNHYDLVLMDIQMPVMDGVEAAQAIRSASAAFRDIPIIALSADALAGDIESWLESGMNSYLIKPIRPDDLRECICKVLQ